MQTLIPESYLDLINGPRVAALTTVMPDGQPQTTVVWCNFDGTHVLVNTMRGFRKEQNMRCNPKVTLLAYDPHSPLHALVLFSRPIPTSSMLIRRFFRDGLSELEKPSANQDVPNPQTHDRKE